MEKIKNILSDLPFLDKFFEPKPKVAVIRMTGIIADSSQIRRAGISHAKFKKIIEKAFDLKPLKAVVLVINSPGGAPVQCALIANQIRKLAVEKEMPVYAFIEDVAASGGYWLACAADEIYVQESSIVGSVGVISAGFGLEDFIARYNIKRRVYTSGLDKSFLDPFLPERERDVQRLFALQADMHNTFKVWVKTRRGERLHGSDSELLDGDFWTGNEAIKRGMVDYLGDVSTIMKDKFGKDVRFIELETEKKFPIPGIPFGAHAASPEWIESALNEIETRAFWSRYGM